MIGNKSFLNSYSTPYSHSLVIWADRSRIQIMGLGTICINTNLSPFHVLQVPKFSFNLVC